MAITTPGKSQIAPQSYITYVDSKSSASNLYRRRATLRNMKNKAKCRQEIAKSRPKLDTIKIVL